jgi:hypothetical protein
VTPVVATFSPTNRWTNHVDVGAGAGGYFYIVVSVDAHGK